MKQWELWKFPYPTEERAHWFVIISTPTRCENNQELIVNGLICTTLRPVGRDLRPHELRLDAADGLAWDTVVKCSHIHELPKMRAREKLGLVSLFRQREIVRKLNACLFGG